MQKTQVTSQYKFTVPWASAVTAGPAYVTPVIPLSASDNNASQQQGFPIETGTNPSAGGKPPNMGDFNGFGMYNTAWLQLIQCGYVPTYDPIQQAGINGYFNGAVVQSATYPGVFYISTADNNGNDPDTGGANWTKIPAYLPYYMQDTGTVNAIAANLTPPVTAYSQLTGTLIAIKVAITNTGATTINLNSLGAVALVNTDGSSLLSQRILANSVITVVYDGSRFQIESGASPTAHGQTIFVTSGSFTCPSGVNEVYVECWGGGGGSAGFDGSSGAGGGYAAGWVAVVPGTSYTITCAAGGSAGYPSGTNGGNSTAFGITANGGTGGGAGPGPGGSGSGASLIIQGQGGTDLDDSTILFAIGGNSPRGGLGGTINAAGSGLNPSAPGGGGGANSAAEGCFQNGAAGWVSVRW